MTVEQGKPWEELLEEIHQLRAKLTNIKSGEFRGDSRDSALGKHITLDSWLDSIFEVFPFSVALYDLDGNIKKCNRYFAVFHATNGSPEAQIGRKLTEFFVPEDRAKLLESIRKTAVENKRLRTPIEYRMLREDGTIFPAEGFSIPLPNPDGKVDKLLGFAYDVIDRKEVEQSLRESQRTLITLMSNLPGVVYRSLLTPKWTMLFIRQGCLELTGYEPAELINNRTIAYGELIHPDDRDYIWQEINESLDPKRHFELQYRIKTRDGQIRWVREKGVGIFDDDGNILWIEGFISDVTEQREIEQALKKSEQLYRATFSQAMESIVLFEPGTGKILDFNDKACKSLGYTHGEFEKLGLSDIEAFESEEQVKTRIDKISHDGGCIFEATHRTKNGELRNVIVSSNVISFERNKVIQAIWTDITERKKIESALRKERNRAQKYLDVAEVIFVVLDANGDITLINKKGCEITGYDEQDIIGKNWFDNFLPEHTKDYVKSSFNKLMSGEIKPAECFENPVLTKDGRERIIAWRNTVLRNEQGEITHTLGSGEDITARKLAEKKLRDYHEKLKLMVASSQLTEQRERQRIARGLHDDIGQKLAVLKFALSSVLQRKRSYDVEESIRKICSDVEAVIEQVRSLTFELSNPVLSELGIEAALERHLIREVRRKHGIEFDLNTCGEFGQLDEDVSMCLFRSVRELLNNVVKHANANYIEITLQCEDENIVITVRDNGVGFEPASLADTAGRQGGFGLFSICEQLESFDGRLEIDSSPEHGSRFTIIIPFIRKNNDPQ
jgi:PAS domain S-box-containing protein